MTDIPEGFKSLTGISPAEDHIGPFYYKKSEQGLSLGFRAGAHNCNGIDTVHGGVLMAFADYAVTMLALSGVKENCTSISFSSDFIVAARLGDWVEARGTYASLNVAQAVQVFAYELRIASDSPENEAAVEPVNLATHEEVEHFYEHLERTLHSTGFLNPAQPGRLMQRMRRLFARSRLEKEEVNILRGILSAMQDKAQ